jgi:hypothetical protein
MHSSVDLVCVDPARVREVWPYARQFIAAAIQRTELSSVNDIEQAILNGKQLWLAWNGKVIEAAAATELAKVGAKLICTLTACGGNHRERWVHLFKKIEQYAKDEGASAMRIYGRRGWERVLDGYRVEHVILEKRL